MAGEGFGAGRYAAFISYSHKDAKAARWLHRRIEGYRIPRRLVGTEGERGPIPARLTPVFRDRDELPAAGDLSQKVRAALGASDNLIVICSPHSAASPWVAKEISAFRELHPGRPVFAAILEGDPAQCFPPSLRFETEGGPEMEPLAADLRAEGDGKRLGLLKLVAGLTGVGLDALVQRDAQRRVRRVTAVTLAALTAMLAMAVLTIFALNARAEAERQRAGAEGLVEFMLTDLRDRLEGVGRLDVLTAVNQRALDHYEGQDLEGLPADALERRARILQAMGEDDEKRGDVDRALAQFREAARTTAALLAADPDNPDRIFAHSQSEYWVGYIDYQRGRYAQAKPAFERYKALSDRLVAIDPANPEWLKEAGYAEGNLCALALEKPSDAQAALTACAAALRHMEKVLQLRGSNPQIVQDLVNRHAWLADAWKLNGRKDKMMEHRRLQEGLARSLVESDPKNLDYRDIWARTQLTFGQLLIDEGAWREARRRLGDASDTLAMLRANDPKNGSWRSLQERVETANDRLKRGGLR